MKNHIKGARRFGWTVIFAEGVFILFLLTVLYFQGKTVDTLRQGEEARSAAVLAAELRTMEETAEAADLTDAAKRLILYRKAGAARDAVWGTAASEEVKRELSAFLGTLSAHLLEAPSDDGTSLLTSEERDTLRLLSEGAYTAALRHEETESIAVHMGSVTEDVSAEEKAANHFLGVEDVLRREWRGIYSCKTAYVRFDGKGIPCEVVRYCPSWRAGEAAEACREKVREYVGKLWPEAIIEVWREEGDGVMLLRSDIAFGSGGMEK